MNTGKKIKLIRTFRGLTQKELGEACGIHEVAIRKYELGKNIPKPEQLRCLRNVHPATRVFL